MHVFNDAEIHKIDRMVFTHFQPIILYLIATDDRTDVLRIDTMNKTRLHSNYKIPLQNIPNGCYRNPFKICGKTGKKQ